MLVEIEILLLALQIIILLLYIIHKSTGKVKTICKILLGLILVIELNFVLGRLKESLSYTPDVYNFHKYDFDS